MLAHPFQQVAEAKSCTPEHVRDISAEAKLALLHWRWSLLLAAGWSSAMFSGSWLNALMHFPAGTYQDARQDETHSHMPRLARAGTFKAFPTSVWRQLIHKMVICCLLKVCTLPLALALDWTVHSLHVLQVWILRVVLPGMKSSA